MNGIEQKTENTIVYLAVAAGAFAAGGAVFGFAWTRYEAPYFMAVQWAFGAGVLGWLAAGSLLATREAVAAGLSYLIASLLVLFIVVALAEFPAPLAIAAGATGAVMGSLVSRWAGAVWVGSAALVGFGVAELAAAALRDVAPAAVASPGAAQALWFSLGQALIGAIGGAAVGYGFARAVKARGSGHRGPRRKETARDAQSS